jgi:glycosyltransferase involved in cell wall biosynthesis
MKAQKPPSVAVIAPLWSRLPRDGYGAIERVTIERILAYGKHGLRTQFVGNCSSRTIADSVLDIRKEFRYPPTPARRLAWFASGAWTRYVLHYRAVQDKIWDCPIVVDATVADPMNNFLLSAVLGRQRSIFILHGNFYFTRPISDLLSAPFNFLSRRMTYGALNTRLASEMDSRGFRAYYLPNGVNCPPRSAVVARPDDYLIYIGALNEDKAPHLAIDMAERAGVRLMVIGPIQDNAYFRLRIRPRLSGRVTYLGEVPRTRLIALLSRAKALVFPSQWSDPQPTVVLEALSYGVPVVALKPGYFSGVYDAVKDGENGFLVDANSAHLKMDEVGALDRLGIHEGASNSWSWDSVVSRFHLPVFQGIASSIAHTDLLRSMRDFPRPL